MRKCPLLELREIEVSYHSSSANAVILIVVRHCSLSLGVHDMKDAHNLETLVSSGKRLLVGFLHLSVRLSYESVLCSVKHRPRVGREGTQ